MNDIPSEEDFARAKRFMQRRLRGLDAVQHAVDLRFVEGGSIHRFDIFPNDETTFDALIFFRRNVDIEAAEDSGLTQRLKEFVYEQLELVGRGTRDELLVNFELDSEENVRTKFGGSYYDRLR